MGVSNRPPPPTLYESSLPLDGVPFIDTADSALLEECRPLPACFWPDAEGLEEPQNVSTPPQVELENELVLEPGVDVEAEDFDLSAVLDEDDSFCSEEEEEEEEEGDESCDLRVERVGVVCAGVGVAFFTAGEGIVVVGVFVLTEVEKSKFGKQIN